MPVVTMRVSVKPSSREASLERREDGTWVARLKSPPVDGKANAELIALVAARFGCRKADVTLKAGAAGRTKLLSVETA
jgi:uncharacterized protein